jgi:hypothetical protein
MLILGFWSRLSAHASIRRGLRSAQEDFNPQPSDPQFALMIEVVKIVVSELGKNSWLRIHGAWHGLTMMPGFLWDFREIPLHPVSS